jgi:hypothetical protein
MIEHKPIEESIEETHFVLRAFFMDIVTNAHSQHIKILITNQSQEVILDISFLQDLISALIPFFTPTCQ